MIFTYTVTSEQVEKAIEALVAEGFKVTTGVTGIQSVELKKFGADVQGVYTPATGQLVMNVIHEPWFGHGDLEAFAAECDAAVKQFLA